MIPTTFNVAMGAVLTAHLRSVRKGEPVEQAYDGTRILSQMEMDRDRTVDGGGYIHTQISATVAAKGGSYEGADGINEDASDEDTMAITSLRFYSEPIKVFRSDVIKAGGTAGAEERLFKYVENKRKQAMRRIRVGIETDMVAETAGAKDITSLVEGITPDHTVSGTIVDGIDRTTETYWRNQQQQVGSLTANFEKIEELSLDCQKGGESDWDYGLTDKATFLKLKKLGRTYLSLNAGTAESTNGRRMADLGIPVIEIEGKPITWSPRLNGTKSWAAYGGSASGGALYLMRKGALCLCPVPDEEWEIEGPFPLEARDTPQHGMKWHVMWAGQNVWEEPSACGVAWDITP